VADDTLPPCKRTVPVPNGAALGGALTAAMPGDCLIAASGEYGAVTIGAKGTAAAPIVLRAEARGMAVFTGRVNLTGAEYVVIDGFNHTGAAGVTITSGNNNRITRSRFRLGGGTFVSVTGTSNANRIDHNEFGPLSAAGHYIHPTGMSERTRIDHNYLHDLAPCGSNGCETISLGCCGVVADAHETFNVVEHNLLVNCDGESEMIGMKSSSNTVRFNTIRSSRGQISFRAGKKNTVHSNYILGEGKAGTQGIRMLDEDHLVYNNYVDVQAFPLRMQHGDVPGFPPIRRARVVHNTFVVSGAPVELGGTGHSIAPMDSSFANNLILGSGTLITEKANGITLQNNVAFVMGGGSVGVTKPADQLRVMDPMVTKTGAIWRPAAGSVLIDAAMGSFPFVTHDADGLPRTQPDIGAHEAGGMGKGPLTPADVGPDGP
jgi:poly(beta-D-mannuronate) lyase